MLDKILVIDNKTRLRKTTCELLSYPGHDLRGTQDIMERLEKSNNYT